MQNVIMGGNAPLATDRFDLIIEWPQSAGTLDTSAYLLDRTGKVRSDADMIFYNQRSDEAGAVTITSMDAGRTQIAVDLGRAPQDIERIMVCVTIEEAGRTMAAFQGIAANIVADGGPLLSFQPALAGAREVAMRLIELYRRNGAWKFRADGQGFNDGLAPLARSFGIDVAEDEPAPPREAAPPSAPVAPALPSALPARQRLSEPARDVSAPSPRAEDGTTLLSPNRPTFSWAGAAHPFGEIAAKLAWKSQCGGLHGRPRPLELELGCFYELQDGRKGLVQSWDNNGQFDTAPHVHLSAAQADGAAGEQKLRINGAGWPAIRKLTLFAFFPSGAPNWHKASLLLTLSASDQRPVNLVLDQGINGCGIVGLMSVENLENDVEFRRLARFATGHQELDRDLGWDLHWATRYA